MKNELELPQGMELERNDDGALTIPVYNSDGSLSGRCIFLSCPGEKVVLRAKVPETLLETEFPDFVQFYANQLTELVGQIRSGKINKPSANENLPIVEYSA